MSPQGRPTKSAPRWWSSPPALLAAIAIVATLGTEIAFGRLKGPPANLVLFFGRLHPLIVHLPIGMFVLVGLAEAMTLLARFRSRIDPVLGLALPVLLLAAFAAFVLGHLLGAAGGYPARLLGWHRRLELWAVLATGLALLAWAYQAQAQTGAARAGFRALLGLSLGVLSIGAHFGGSLTHGDSYLTQYAPDPLKALLGVRAEPKALSSAPLPPRAPNVEPLLYADAVEPLLVHYCVGCHGPEKSKGKLRLDSLAAALKGGEHGPGIVPGAAARSSLVTRLRLPVSDDHHMPPEGKPAPTPQEIELIEFWIDRGANSTARVRDALPPSDTRAVLERALQGQPGAATQAPVSTAPEPAVADKTAPLAAAKAELSPTVSQPRSARAILADKCQGCHGPSKQESKLRVDSVAALLVGGFGGPALVPGDPNKSEIIVRTRLPLGDEDHMPPPKKPQLSAQDLATLEAWVRQGTGAPSRAAPPASSQVAASAEGPIPSPRAESAQNAGSASAHAEPETTPAAPPVAAEGSKPRENKGNAPSDATLRRGGCAACTVGSSAFQAPGSTALGFALLVAVALFQRRRSRSRRAAWALTSGARKRNRMETS